MVTVRGADSVVNYDEESTPQLRVSRVLLGFVYIYSEENSGQWTGNLNNSFIQIGEVVLGKLSEGRGDMGSDTPPRFPGKGRVIDSLEDL